MWIAQCVYKPRSSFIHFACIGVAPPRLFTPYAYNNYYYSTMVHKNTLICFIVEHCMVYMYSKLCMNLCTIQYTNTLARTAIPTKLTVVSVAPNQNSTEGRPDYIRTYISFVLYNNTGRQGYQIRYSILTCCLSRIFWLIYRTYWKWM